MAQIRWNKSSVRDLKNIFDFIAIDSRLYAFRFVSRIIESVEQLSEFPKSGRIVPEKNDPAIREVIVGNYRVFYHFNKDTVTILRIHHSARNVK